MPSNSPQFEAGLKQRKVIELINQLVFRPLGFLVVRLLWVSPVRPEHLVIAHGVLGFLAAFFLVQQRFLAAAILLQLVTVLDNADGQLARSRGQESLLGRYLDTEVDFLVHIAIFVALAQVCGLQPAFIGLAMLTLLLSLDHNLVAVAQEKAAIKPEQGLEKRLGDVYRAIFGWQDSLLQRLERGLPKPPAWFYWLIANLGRTTQFVVLGIALAVGRPCGYLVFIYLATFIIFLVYASRIWAKAANSQSPR